MKESANAMQSIVGVSRAKLSLVDMVGGFSRVAMV